MKIFFPIWNYLPESYQAPSNTIMVQKDKSGATIILKPCGALPMSSLSAFSAPLWGRFYHFSHFLRIREWKQRGWVIWVRSLGQSTTRQAPEPFGLTQAPRSNLMTRAPWKLIAGHWQQVFANHTEAVPEARRLEKRLWGMTEPNDTFSEILNHTSTWYSMEEWVKHKVTFFLRMAPVVPSWYEEKRWGQATSKDMLRPPPGKHMVAFSQHLLHEQRNASGMKTHSWMSLQQKILSHLFHPDSLFQPSWKPANISSTLTIVQALC